MQSRGAGRDTGKELGPWPYFLPVPWTYPGTSRLDPFPLAARTGSRSKANIYPDVIQSGWAPPAFLGFERPDLTAAGMRVAGRHASIGSPASVNFRGWMGPLYGACFATGTQVHIGQTYIPSNIWRIKTKHVCHVPTHNLHAVSTQELHATHMSHPIQHVYATNT